MSSRFASAAERLLLKFCNSFKRPLRHMPMKDAPPSHAFCARNGIDGKAMAASKTWPVAICCLVSSAGVSFKCRRGRNQRLITKASCWLLRLLKNKPLRRSTAASTRWRVALRKVDGWDRRAAHAGVRGLVALRFGHRRHQSHTSFQRRGIVRSHRQRLVAGLAVLGRNFEIVLCRVRRRGQSQSLALRR